MKNKEPIPFEATLPGELIKDELKSRKLTQKKLAEIMGVTPSVLSETINGKRPISTNVAIALEKALDIPASMWLNLQTQYDVDLANIRSRDEESVFSSARILIETLLKKIGHVSDADKYELYRIGSLVNSYDREDSSVQVAL